MLNHFGTVSTVAEESLRPEEMNNIKNEIYLVGGEWVRCNGLL